MKKESSIDLSNKATYYVVFQYGPMQPGRQVPAEGRSKEEIGERYKVMPYSVKGPYVKNEEYYKIKKLQAEVQRTSSVFGSF